MNDGVALSLNLLFLGGKKAVGAVSTLVVSALLLVFVPSSALAQFPERQAVRLETPEPRDFSFSVAARAWATTGYAVFSEKFDGIDPLSDLRWKAIESLVTEVNGEVVWKKLVVLGSLGRGEINDGVFIDDDFLQQDFNGRFSHTRSTVEDSSLFYANVDVGYRLANWVGAGRRTGYLDLLVGYQYWNEEYKAFGARGTVGLSGEIPVSEPDNVKVITEEYTWHSIRIGTRFKYPFWRGFDFDLKLFYVPWSSFRLEDIHHLRTDLKQNPSVVVTSSGGSGVQVDVGLGWTVWRGLSVEGGFTYWRLTAGDGDVAVRGTTGTVKAKISEAMLERYGPYFGLRYRF